MAEHTAVLAGYETTFITGPELTDDGLKQLHERIAQVVASFGGSVILTEDWGKRKLAYPIEKETKGHYTYIVYTGRGSVVHELERTFRIHDHVLRFLTVLLDSEFDGDVFRKQRADAHAASKRREEEREARREERETRRSSYGYDEDRRNEYDYLAEEMTARAARSEDEE